MKTLEAPSRSALQSLPETKSERTDSTRSFSNASQETTTANKVKDKVEISGIIQKVKEADAQQQSVQTEKLAALKARIESGKYQVPGLEVAAKMLSRLSDPHQLN